MKPSFAALVSVSLLACGAQAVVQRPPSPGASGVTGTGAPSAGASAASALPTAGRVVARSSSPTDARVRLGDELDLGFVKIRLQRIAPCTSTSRVAVLDVTWTTKPGPGDDKLTGELVDDGGKVLGKPSNIGFCDEDDAPPSASADGEQHLFVDSSPAASWLVVTVEEPHRYARYRVSLALRSDVAPVTLAPAVPARPPPVAARLGDPVETPYYRITPVALHNCGYTMYGRDLWGAEIVVENFSNVPISFPASASMVDEQGRKFEQAYQERGPCSPALDAADVPPGESRRGFVRPVEVARDAKSVDLLYALDSRSFWSPAEVHRLHLGALPLAALRGTWEPPAATSTSAAGYRVTVTSVRRCAIGDAGKDYVGVELLVENTAPSGELSGNMTSTLEDSASYRFEPALNPELTECTPSLGNPFTLKPGQKVRGWLEAFNVAVDSGPWMLHYRMWQDAPGGSRNTETTIDLPLGKLSAPKTP